VYKSIAGLASADGSHTPLLQQLMPHVLDVLDACVVGSIGTGASAHAHGAIEMLLEIIEAPQPILAQCMPRVVEFARRCACSTELELGLRNHGSQVHDFCVFFNKVLCRLVATSMTLVRSAGVLWRSSGHWRLIYCTSP
jgi:hypothetical protein